MSEEKIQVCLVTYHRNEMLMRAVESVRRQTFHNFECWIVKDGCQDASTIRPYRVERTCLECEDCLKTQRFAKHIAQKDCRFRYFCLPINMHGWAFGTRNFCLLNTELDLIAYLDDDNWWEPRHLELLYKTLQSSNAQFAFTGTQVWRGDQKQWTRVVTSPPHFCGIDTNEIMHRRELIFQYGGWRGDPNDPTVGFANDWDLVERWMRNNVPWAHTGVVTTNYSLH